MAAAVYLHSNYMPYKVEGWERCLGDCQLHFAQSQKQAGSLPTPNGKASGINPYQGGRTKAARLA